MYLLMQVFDSAAVRVVPEAARAANGGGGRIGLGRGRSGGGGGARKGNGFDDRPIGGLGAKRTAAGGSSWRDKSEQFRQAMRAARGVTAAIKAGVNPRDIPMAPSVPDPSLILCPHCGRRFNEKAAERHIPKCQDIRAKPTMLRAGGGRGGGRHGRF